MVEVTDHPEGTVLAVRAQPGARRSGVLGEYSGALKLAVTVSPEDGRANRALTELIAGLFGLRRSQVELTKGPASRTKRFLLRGVNRDQAAARVKELLAEAQ